MTSNVNTKRHVHVSATYKPYVATNTADFSLTCARSRLHHGNRLLFNPVQLSRSSCKCRVALSRKADTEGISRILRGPDVHT